MRMQTFPAMRDCEVVVRIPTATWDELCGDQDNAWLEGRSYTISDACDLKAMDAVPST